MEPITLTWQNIKASVKDKVILHPSSGYCKPGEMLAIMGPSGSGKTTMLSLLCYKNDSVIESQGKVLANNNKFDNQSFNNFGAFIYQNDLLYQTLTVRQTLQFTANIKKGTKEQAESIVRELVVQFQLQGCMETFVGGQFVKGISGGQKKRVCIAVQMISKPSLIILDEPTSGLDSNKAARILQVLKKLTKEGHTVIFTIHQPSGLLYSLLDRLILLNNGQTIYQGTAKAIETYMNSLGVVVPKNSTICDHFMMEISEYKRVNKNYDTPLNVENYVKHNKKPIQMETSQISQESFIGLKERKNEQTFTKMFGLLFHRQWLNYKRNPMKFYGMIGNALILVIILGLIFINSIMSIEDIAALAATSLDAKDFFLKMNVSFIMAQGTSFVNCTSNIMVGIFSVALSFPLERPIYAKEVSSKKYTPIAYFVAKIIVQVSSAIIGTVFYSSIGYWLLGYTATFQQFIFFTLTLVAVTLVGNSIGFFTGSLFKDPKKATSLAPMFLLPLMMFSGLYNKLNSIPSWISWVQYISPFKYGLHMLLTNEYNDAIFYYKDTNDIVYDYNYKTDLQISLNWISNFGVLLGLSLLFYTLSFVLLKKSSTKISV